MLKREKSGSVQHSSGILHNWNHISTHVSKVFVPYFSDFIEARVQIASFLWKYWNGGHLRGHLLAINRTTEADTQQTCWQLWKTESHHRDVKIKRVIGLDVLCRQIRWGHLSVPDILHNLAFSNIQKKCGRMPQQVLHNPFWDTCWKKPTKTIHGLEQCLPLAFGATVASTMRRISSSGEFTTGCCKTYEIFTSHFNSCPCFASPSPAKLLCYFTSGLLAGLGCAAADSIHGSKIDVKNKVPLCIIFFPRWWKTATAFHTGFWGKCGQEKIFPSSFLEAAKSCWVRIKY